MHYFTNELQLTLPEIATDRSVNVLTLTDPQRGVPFQFIINRDLLLAGETLEQSFDRQLGVMTRQTQAFKAVTKRRCEIGAAKMPGVEVESSFKQASKTYYQIQAMCVTQAPQVAVLTLSSHVPIHEGHREIWKKALDSFVLRAKEKT